MEDNRKLLAKNSFFNVIYRLMNILFPLITSMYIARILLPEKIGIISAAQNIASYFTLFASMGIPVYGTSFIAQIKKDTKNFSKSFMEIFLINCVLSLISTVIYYNLILFIPYFSDRRLIYCLTGIPLILNIFNVDWLYQGIQEYAYITIRSFFVKCLLLVMLFAFVHDTNDYIIYILINLIAQSGNYLFNIYRLQNYIKLTLNNLQFKKHLIHIFSLFMASIAAEIYVLADVTMLDIMTNSTSVGFYTMGTKIIGIFKGLVTAVTTAFLPQLSEYYINKEYTPFSKLINNGLQFIFSISIPIIIGLILCVDDAIFVVYGKNYSLSVGVTKILSVSILSVALSNFIGLQILVILGKEKTTTLSTTVGAISNICLNYFLIKLLGIIGAAVASVIAEICVTSIQIIFVKKFVDFKVKFSKVLCATFMMAIIIIPIHNIKIILVIRLLIECILGLAVYSGVLILLKDEFAIKVITFINKQLIKKKY